MRPQAAPGQSPRLTGAAFFLVAGRIGDAPARWLRAFRHLMIRVVFIPQRETIN